MNIGEKVVYLGKEAEILDIGRAADKANPEQKVMIMIEGESTPKIVNASQLSPLKKGLL